MAVNIDKYNYNDVIPKLKCNSPCYNCYAADPNFCTSCWGNKNDNKKIYLQYRSIKNIIGKLDVESTCEDKCDPGSSINGEGVGVKMAKIELPDGSSTTSEIKRGSEVRITEASEDMRDHISLENSYFKCTECDQTCKTCRGETATNGFVNPGWVEDKSQCLQPCPASTTNDKTARNLPYFIKEPVEPLTDDEKAAKETRDKNKAREKGIPYVAPVPSPYGYSTSCLTICTAQYYYMWKDGKKDVPVDNRWHEAGYR